MKKLVFGCVLLLIFGTVFAVEYQGDIQLTFGGFNIQKAEYSAFDGSSWSGYEKVPSAQKEFGDTRFYDSASKKWNPDTYTKYGVTFFEIGNSNLFELHPIVAVGFMEKVSIGTVNWSTTANYDTYGEPRVDIGYTFGLIRIAPVVAVTAPDVVRFQFALGFGLNIDDENILFLDGPVYNKNGREKTMTVLPGMYLDVQAKFVPHKAVSPLIGFEYMLMPDKVYDMSGDVLSKIRMHNMKIYAGLTINFWNK